MTDNWDSYFCHVDGKPASILVNLALAARAPLAACPVLGYVSVALREPDELGFPGDREYAALGELEDRLEEALAVNGQALYAGRCAVDGRFDCFFYLRDAAGWNSRVALAMTSFPEYTFEAGAYDDPEWESYRYFLFPGEYDMLAIQNRRVRQALEERGYDPAVSRMISHWAEFPDAGSADSFSRAAQDLGFSPGSAEFVTGDEEGDGVRAFARESLSAAPRGMYRLLFSRPDAPSDLDAAVFSLADLAREYGGQYQGWSVPLEE